MNTKTEYHHVRALEGAPEKREDFLAETCRSDTGQQGKPKGTAMQRIPQPLRSVSKALHLILFSLGLFLITGSALHAKGKGSGNGGGGGGGGETPPGVVYIGNLGDYYSMNSDGSALTFLFYDSVEAVEPSHDLHAGERWFLQFRAIGTLFPDGRQRFELFARNVTGDSIQQLTDDPTLQIDVSGLGSTNPRWAPNDSSVAFVARRWATDPDGLFVVDPVTGLSVVEEVGIYEIELLGGDVASVVSPGEPVRLNVGIPERIEAIGTNSSGDEIGYLAHDISGFDWSPDATMIVYGYEIAGEEGDMEGHLVFTTLEDGVSTSVYVGRNTRPRWSPDGSQISYHDLDTAYVLDISGTFPEVTPILDRGSSGAKSTRNGAINTPLYWAPNSDYLVFSRVIASFNSNRMRVNADVCISTNTGSEETCLNLSLDLDYPLGWRN